ncbi:unnamed protein product, partial [Timema podura]|nr:unnamed protein product [Timema podura]
MVGLYVVAILVAGAGGMMDPRDHMRGVVDTMRGDVGMRDLRGLADMRGGGGDPMMRGDPRGISGRLNGPAADAAMWAQPPQPPHHHGAPHHQQAQPPNKMVGPGGINAPGVNQWAGPPPKDMGMPGAGGKPSGWEEPSPPAQRRNMPNYDDGTSLWGNPGQPGRMGGEAKYLTGKEMPTPNLGRGGMQLPPGMSQNRHPGNNGGNMKPDGPIWGHPTRNGSWGDGPHDSNAPSWGDDGKQGVGVNSWNEPPLTPTAWVGGPKPKNPLNPSWVDDDVPPPWGPPPKQ